MEVHFECISASVELKQEKSKPNFDVVFVTL